MATCKGYVPAPSDKVLTVFPLLFPSFHPLTFRGEGSESEEPVTGRNRLQLDGETRSIQNWYSNSHQLSYKDGVKLFQLI